MQSHYVCSWVVLVVAAIVPGLYAEQAVSSVAFTHVAVVPMNREQVLRDQTVLVNGDVIITVGPTATVAVPPEAIRIDGTGQYLIPGMTDMHVHLQRDTSEAGNRWMLILFIANGITTVRNMWGTPQHLRLRSNIANGSELGPDIYTSGPVIDGYPPQWKSSVVIRTTAEARVEVTSEKADGYDFIKVYSHLSKEAYRSILAVARENRIRVVGHVPLDVGIREALQSGQASIEHLDGYISAIQADSSPVYGKTDWYSQMIAYGFVDPSRLQSISEETKEAGVWNCPTLVTMSKWVDSDLRDSLLNRPEIKFVPSSVRRDWKVLSDAQLGGFSRIDFIKLKRSDEVRSKIVEALHSAGALILSGTDTPNAFVVPGFSLHEELKRLVDAGLTPYEALSASTSNAARFLGKLSTFGTIEVGKRADLVLLGDNPLDDISNVSKVNGVMLRGRWIQAAELHKLLLSLVPEADAPSTNNSSDR